MRSLIRLARLEGADDKSDKEGKTITGVATNPHHFMWLTPPLFRDLFYVDLPWKVLWVKSVLSKCNFEGYKLEERMLKLFRCCSPECFGSVPPVL